MIASEIKDKGIVKLKINRKVKSNNHQTNGATMNDFAKI